MKQRFREWFCVLTGGHGWPQVREDRVICPKCHKTWSNR